VIIWLKASASAPISSSAQWGARRLDQIQDRAGEQPGERDGRNDPHHGDGEGGKEHLAGDRIDNPGQAGFGQPDAHKPGAAIKDWGAKFVDHSFCAAVGQMGDFAAGMGLGPTGERRIKQRNRKPIVAKGVGQHVILIIDHKGIERIRMVGDCTRKQLIEGVGVVEQNRIHAARRQITGHGNAAILQLTHKDALHHTAHLPGDAKAQHRGEDKHNPHDFGADIDTA
jgi:hypothetical protein